MVLDTARKSENCTHSSQVVANVDLKQPLNGKLEIVESPKSLQFSAKKPITALVQNVPASG